MAGYKSTFAYKLIYIMRIPDEEHKGLIKIGEATLDSTLGPSQLPPCCDALNAAAHSRVKEYTHTAMVQYDLLHTELAIQKIEMDDGSSILKSFSDKDVHRIIKRAGYFCKTFYDTGNESEWFRVDLETAKNAIRAFKEGRSDLSAGEKIFTLDGKPRQISEEITLRAEQVAAVAKTKSVFKKFDRMLWNCKMRFGKTVTAYELIRREGYQKSIVVTHRPVVVKGWREDHDKIFGGSEHMFVTKQTGSAEYEFDAAIDSENERMLKNYAEQGVSFTYFASMQDLRGSICAGGKFEKNNAVFDMDWDIIIYDEAHEGTQTDHGQSVRDLLEEPKHGKKPKVLSLSGTPYNIQDDYEEYNTYTWDYVMEQRCKRDFALNHPDEPNPYADLPELRIYTFDLQKNLPTSYRYATEDMAFNFREFFRTWTGDPKRDFRPIPSGKSVGDFVHEDDVIAFLDLIVTDSADSNYPFSNEEYRNMFRHTFWIVPGVKEARALSKLLRKHPVFSQFEIANVAGEGDEEEPYDEALKKVQDTIARSKYTITLSCGRLTTGVTVPEWSAVMMLTGGANASASGYMQTIFRVQSAGSIDGKQKTCAYVFDFAPDRALNVISEVHELTRHGKMTDEERRNVLGEFLNFCPVISVEGTRMVPYSTSSLMRQIKKITVDKAVNSGFDDDSIYNEGVGIVMDGNDVLLFNQLAGIVQGQSKAKGAKKVVINETGMTNEQYDIAEKAKNKPKRERSPEEEAAIKKQQELKKEREKVLRLLRAVSIRLPMLIYGARVDIEEDIPMEKFIEIVDDESWDEFMPEGVTKALFKKLLKYYDQDVVSGAGFRIRRMAKAADELPPIRRALRIAEILSHFRNPDKETVLTPWRVVNMHMSDTIGGYCFFDEDFDQNKPLDEPRLVDNGDVTANVFCNPDAHLLEMNSKSGLYPLYLACSMYSLNLSKPESDMPLEESQRIWREIVEKNIYVLCRTDMACSITRRTLVGYKDDWTVRAIHLSRLLDRMNDKPRLARKLSNPKIWQIEGERVKFDAIVGNPPYQIPDGGSKASAMPLYQMFVAQAVEMNPQYISMIMPAKWYSGGRNLDAFRTMMLKDNRLSLLHDYSDSNECFQGVDIAGGLCYFLWDRDYNGNCTVVNHNHGEVSITIRDLNADDIFIRNGKSLPIVTKLRARSSSYYSERVSAQRPFGLRTYVTPLTEGDITLRYSKGRGPYKRELVSSGQKWIDKWKVIISYLTYDHAGRADKNGQRRIFSTLEILKPGEVCTETYIVIDAFDTETEAANLMKYLKTKFVRFLVLQVTTTQHLSKASFMLVPIQEFTKPWTDAELYAKYSLTDDEISFVEATIKPME